jgi:hypothetical protein
MNFTDYVNNLNLSDKRSKNIIYSYNKYLDIFDEVIPKDILKNINNKDIYPTDSMVKNLLGVFVHFYKFRNLDPTKLQNELKKLNIKMNDGYRQRNIKLKKELPTMSQLQQFNLENYKNKRFRAFIINYLLLNYGVRNKDLNLIITRNSKNLDKTKNYLVVRKNTLNYIRNDYKTKNVYNSKKNVIKSIRLLEAAEELLGDMEAVGLLQNTINLGQEIQKYTFNNLLEGDIFKIVVSSKKSLKDVERLTDKRGSSVNVVLNNYNLNV